MATVGNIDWRSEHRFEAERQSRELFSPAGRCIYCGAAQGYLGEEHVWPDGLNGHLILPKASCKDCEGRIDRFEQPVIRTNFGFARMANGLRSKKRRPGKVRPTTFLAQAPDRPDLMLPIGPMMPQIVMAETPGRRASVISGVEHPSGPGVRHVGATNPAARLPSGYGVSVDRFRTGNFPRFLAKVAHSYACGVIGRSAFEPMLTGLILGSEPASRSRYLGDLPKLSESGPLNVIRLGFYDGDLYLLPGLPAQRGVAIIVQLEIFSPLALPTFEAVVGVTI